MRIFLPTGVFLFICALYSGYWFWAADHLEGMVTDWAQEQRDAGTKVSWSALDVRGYPFRLEAHFRNPRIEAPQWSWRGEKFVIYMMPYSFRHYIGTFEGTHAIRVKAPESGQLLAFEGKAGQARASLVLEKHGGARLSVDLKNLKAHRLDADTGKTLTRMAAERLQVHIRQWFTRKDDGTPEGQLAVAVEADKADWPAHGLKGLGSVIDLARGEFLLSELPLRYDGMRPAIADYLRAWQANGGRAELADFDLRWDNINLSASGRMALDRKGRPKGEIDTRVAGYRSILDVLTSNKVVPDKQAEMVKSALTALNLVSRGKDGRLSLPVRLKKGAIYLGPVKLSSVAPVY